MRIINNIKERLLKNDECYIIAEMSANHGGNFQRAIDLIHLAKKSGADCVKLQTYTADTMTINSNKEYFMLDEGTWKGRNLYELYEEAYTPWEWQKRLKDEIEKLGMDFLSTPFDKTAVDFLESIGIEFYKIASFELTDIPLVRYIASKGKPIIMSTGMATLGEIEEAVNTIRAEGNEDICLLKCSSAYPAVPEDMNLKTIKHLKDTFGVRTGLSDHSLGSVSAITAVALGAKVIEKHFCIDRSIETPDSSFSMEPKEFSEMVKGIRSAEAAVGSVKYINSKNEEISKDCRRSIFVVKDIKKGDILNEENVKVIRPGYGIEPKYYYDIMGKIALFDIERGEPLRWNMVRNDKK